MLSVVGYASNSAEVRHGSSKPPWNAPQVAPCDPIPILGAKLYSHDGELGRHFCMCILGCASCGSIRYIMPCGCLGRSGNATRKKGKEEVKRQISNVNL
uniref:Uncharacterized protein n=1 Tax=Utricularia reniformis TaxID=192314 RepID=A0A1Y0B1I7_9LAMI|nr:hypothetical protein AEK19_MT1029 [Utricularia reniformis]ART31251.1 hypothetical protein AEK19_MT1029 [Utricularia reniformis]